ncbi:type I-E CRISPR-associated protein Cse1/CasA [Streptomyces sp. NPDC087300]|uniref:type I-E CRISPR-associated protein Cse1/CasA n=1 Tax=Streptomyces sp. NPDC087300 TaxID=3365780 RepID=UPI0037FBA71E
MKLVGFDLRDEPWIPVRLAGASARVGLRMLFQRAHEIADLELAVPPAASGLLRILAALAARIARDGQARLGDAQQAEDIDDWFALRAKILTRKKFDPKAVDDYFDQEELAGRFDLFDVDRPFLQDPRLREECVDGRGEPNPSGVNKLVLGRPTGVNGAVLFGHFTDGAPVPVPAAEAAWHLIAQLYYGPSGQCTPRRITSIKPGNGDAGPLRKSVSFHVWAPDLFSTLVLAVPAPLDAPGFNTVDRCPWEEPLPDPAVPAALTWPGRLLTGRARHAALLVPSADHTAVTDAYITWATHLPPAATPDPYVVLDMPKAGGAPYARPADGQRALWRDLDALLLKGSTQSQRPRTFEDLPRSLRPALRVRAYGFHQDGQQKDDSWYEATTPPVLGWQQDGTPENEEMAWRVARCHQAAEEVGDRLHYAARLAWKLTTDPPDDPTAKVRLDAKKPGPWAGRALARYWPAAEGVFWHLLTPGQIDVAPHAPFVRAALGALDEALGSARADVRAARARGRARATLRALIPAGPPSETRT